MNFLEHTLDMLADYGKNVEDIEWIGNEYTFLTWEEFSEMAEGVEDLGTGIDGLGPIPHDLKIVGDVWWLDLDDIPSIEEDGEIQWAYREKPHKPLFAEFNKELRTIIAHNEISDFKIIFGEIE
jgi:hypothetical protein